MILEEVHNYPIRLFRYLMLLSQQGGTISLESVFGKGSTFTVSFPVGEERTDLRTEAARSPAVHVSTTGPNPVVLIVDDEAPARELLMPFYWTYSCPEWTDST